MPGTKSSGETAAMILPGRQYACGNVKTCMSSGVVPSRHVVLVSLSEDCVPGYRRFAL